VGGGVGQVGGGTVEKCSSLAGSFDIAKSGGNLFYIGGFVGNSGGTITGCYSNNPVVVNATDGFTAVIRSGGFSGEGAGTIKYCYALGDMSITSYTGIYAGGFSGSASASFSCCYAVGNVNAYKMGAGNDLCVGGFAGFGFPMSDCYATGDVFFDADSSLPQGYLIYTGALVGFSGNNTSDTVQQCFAKGSVTVQRNTATGEVRAGGLAGYINLNSSGVFRNCVALGASVTVTGGLTRNIGRVYGTKRTESSPSNNRAYNDMKFYESSTPGAGGIVPTTPSSTDGTSKDGVNATLGETRGSAFWQGLGFSSTNWDFNNVGLKGYPRLRASLNGPVMGGQ
jgi:hypothetical protein